MNTAPQQVTERYLSNLLHYGRNKEFDILHIDREESKHQDIVVGYYYTVSIVGKTRNEHAAGATLAEAVRRALEKHGVTFR
jgi:hypothetical protein